jgi:hypothetical protein
MGDLVERTRLDDLAAPRLSPPGERMLAEIGEQAHHIELTPEAVLAAAVAESGLNDFGEQTYREGLELLCRALCDEGGLSPAGKVISYATLVRLARNRLRIEELVSRNPEILDEVIDRPIFIVGLPRTGTTHLVNLIAADPGVRCMRYWEGLEPVPETFERGESEVESRLGRAGEAWSLMEAVIPHMKMMHEMTPDHVHEDIEITALNFSTVLFEAILAPLPSYRDWLRARDRTDAYLYFKKTLQVMQWLRGGTRWVLKTPEHLELLGSLHAVFPDATFVFTHRDPVSITASYATMEAYMARLTQNPVDPHRIGAYWSERIEGMVRACTEDRDLVPAGQSMDILFDEFMADDVAMVQRVYQLADQPFTTESKAAMDAFMIEHPRGKYGAVDYDLNALGLDLAERRAALRFYLDRFGVRPER